MSHVWRPLFVALAVVATILCMRLVLVPDDFGIHEQGYMYGWHRKGNETDWKNVKVKYRTTAYCINCHKDKYQDIKDSPHAAIMCENCHGPALGHPQDPRTLEINRGRELCVRCHFKLPYPNSARGGIKGINPATHHPEAECVLCHYPHNPLRAAVRKEVKR
jgi:predicted CXXCH cytochrome family protein